ncbi:MAG: NAD-dependent epimerase/dehydratase family protein, partial [bacterium]|nr:NAD-dependent epimerase/dehydratase family protein [bacterium]
SAAHDRFQVEHVGIQQIYHGACSSSPTVYTTQPIQSLITSSIGTKNVLDIAVKYRSKVLFLSDARVYGLLPDQKFSPSEEFFGSLNFADSNHAYIEGKRFAENLVQTYASLYSLETKIVRLSTVYGPKMHLDDGRMIPDFISRALRGADIVLTKDLASSSFLYSTDCIDALEKLMLSDLGGIFNIGHGSTYKITDLVKKIVQYTGSQSKVVEGVPSAGEESLYRAWAEECGVTNIVKIKDAIGWFPIVLLDEGLQKTIYYMKSLRGKKGIVR